MPSGAKKRKAAKKKQQQEEASSTQINLKSNNNHESRTQEERESDDGSSSHESYKKTDFTEEDATRIEKEPEFDTDGRIEIIDSGYDHDKSSSSSSSSNSNSSSDDESREDKKRDDDKKTSDSVSEVITVSSVPNQPLPTAGDAPFMGSTANVIVENTGLMDLATPSEQIDISLVDTVTSGEADRLLSLPKPNEITTEVSIASDETRQVTSGVTDSDAKVKEAKTPSLPIESEVVNSHEEEAPVRPSHGIAQRTSWLSCCGLFDVATGSSR